MFRRRSLVTLFALAAVIWLSVAAAQPPTQLYLPLLLDPRPTSAPIASATPTATATATATTTTTATATSSPTVTGTRTAGTTTATPSPTVTGTRTITPTPSATPTASPTGTATRTPTLTPTPVPLNQVLPNGGFENGAAPWTMVSAGVASGAALPVPPRSGSAAALIQAPVGGGARSGYIFQQITLPQQPLVDLVVYYQLRTTEATCNVSSGSVLYIQVNVETPVSFAACAANATTTWQKLTINLSALAGKTITVRLGADLVTEGAAVVFDDISLQARQ